MSNIILIDYENLFNSGTNNHKLKMTNKGFEQIIQHYTKKYNVKDEMVFVSCYYEGYEGLLKFIEELSYTPIRTYELAKDMSDGYLISYGTQALIENKEEIDKVILIAGDKIYTGLVRLSSKLFDETVVVSWKDSFSKYLKEISRKKVTLENLEETFDLQEKIDAGWFESYAIQPAEKELIEFLLKAERDEGYQLVALTKNIQKWKGSNILKQVGTEFDDIKQFIQSRSSNGGFLTQKRAPSPRGDREVIWVKLDRKHSKVQSIATKKT